MEIRRKDRIMAFKWEEPSNPFATQDFKNAVKEATEKLGKELGKIGEQVHADFPFMAYDDMYPEYGGRMRLPYSPVGAWNDAFNILILNGYVVTAHTEVASEVEREVDGIEKWIVIEFDEVE